MQLLVSWETTPELAMTLVKFQDWGSPLEVHLWPTTLQIKRAASSMKERCRSSCCRKHVATAFWAAQCPIALLVSTNQVQWKIHSGHSTLKISSQLTNVTYRSHLVHQIPHATISSRCNRRVSHSLPQFWKLSHSDRAPKTFLLNKN